MAIAGLTDQRASFIELGRIRKGSPKKIIHKNGRDIETVGDDLDHFRVTFREDPVSQATMENFQQYYGSLEPKAIEFFMPFPEIERSWDAFFEFYKQGGRYGQADSYHWIYLRNPRTKELWIQNEEIVSEDSKLLEQLKVDENGKQYLPFDPKVPVDSYYRSNGEEVAVYARPVGRLRTLVPACGVYAHLTLQTTSIYDIARISKFLDAVKSIAEMGGRTIVGIPLILSRRLEPIATPDGHGGRRQALKWLVTVMPDQVWAKEHMRQLQGMAFPQIPDLSGLDLPDQAFDEVDDIETADVDPTSGQEIPDLPDITSGADDPVWNPDQPSLPLMNLDGAKNGKKKSSQAEKTEKEKVVSGLEVDMQTVYWNLVYNKLKWSRQEGMDVLNSCGGDFTMAVVKIKQQLPE